MTTPRSLRRLLPRTGGVVLLGALLVTSVPAGPAVAAAAPGVHAHRATFARPHLIPYRRHDVPLPQRSLPGRAQPLLAAGTLASLVAAPPAGPALSTWQVTYTGFDAASNPQGPAARVAFQAAVDIWARILTSAVPIKVSANFASLPTGYLGYAGASASYPGVGDGQSYYASALADALSGVDQSTLFSGAPASDITAQFQSSSAANFYFGTDGATPAGTVDFESVVLHELGHGVGFAGSMDIDAGTGAGSWSGPERFDRFAYDAASGGAALLQQANPSSALAAKLTDNAVYWGGPHAVAADGGLRPRLYAPTSWQPGSSYSHLDEGTYGVGNPNSLMTPAISAAEVVHSPGALAVGMLADEGWRASLPTGTVAGPAVSITSGPAAATTARTASVSFTGSDSTRPADVLAYTCTFDGQTGPCTSPVTFSALPDGQHVLQVVATDGSGAVSAPATRSWAVDNGAPTVSAGALPVFSLASTVGLRYSGTDVTSGVASYDVRARMAPYNGGFGALVYPSSWQHTTSAAASLTTAPGTTYCLSVRSRDRAGNLSGWSAERCTAVALDDRSMAASSGWARGTGSAYYRGTTTSAARLGVVLTRTGIQARRLTLIATRCVGCGTVGVYWNGVLIKRVSLAASATSYRQSLLLVDFGVARGGNLVLRTLNAGRTYVDGLGASRV